jgi:hypothetical protein
MKASFTHSGISPDAFTVAWKGMVALGLLHTKTGVRFITGRDWNWSAPHFDRTPGATVRA